MTWLFKGGKAKDPLLSMSAGTQLILGVGSSTNPTGNFPPIELPLDNFPRTFPTQIIPILDNFFQTIPTLHDSKFCVGECQRCDMFLIGGTCRGT